MTGGAPAASTCKRCSTLGEERRAHLIAYWGDPLCHDCAQLAAAYFDEHGTWPPVPWTDDDQELIQPTKENP